MSTEAVTVTADPPPPRERTLTAHDRCDRCGAQGYLVFESTGKGLELVFCNHHGRKNEAELFLQGFELTVDETWKLDIKRESSAQGT